MSKDKSEKRIEVQEIRMREIRACIVGTSPLIMHRFSQKAWQELLLPKRKANRAAREQSLKHDPVKEFRGALYLNRDSTRPARFHLPSGMIGKAIAAAAIDMPGAAKATIARLTRVVDVQIDLYGIPNLHMAMVRSSDMARTPDVRTRPIFPQWAAQVGIEYVSSIIDERTISNLLGASGTIVGIGDWRPQKGGSYGCFRLASEIDPEYQLITTTQGVDAQQRAYDDPIYFDEETTELMDWFNEEVASREMEEQLSTKRRKAA